MDNLLSLAVEAHGGLSSWNKLTSLHANISIGGALWDLVGQPRVFNNIHVELDLHLQRVITHLVDTGERIVFALTKVSLESESGEVLDTLIDPRSAFAAQSTDSKWNRLQAGYFSSYALWGYLTTPFLYTYDGFETQEIEPWHENGERWQVLQVSFPKEYAAHTRTQFVYFGDDGLVRRHLYTVDILGGSHGTNYAFEYRSVSGGMIATRRRVLPYDDDRQKVDEPILVSIDISEVRFK